MKFNAAPRKRVAIHPLDDHHQATASLSTTLEVTNKSSLLSLVINIKCKGPVSYETQ